MRRADRRPTTPPADPAGTTPGMQPGASQPGLIQETGNARREASGALPELPDELLESIVRRAIAHEPARESARQLALLQRVDGTFNAAVTRVLHSPDQQHVGRESTFARVEHLARHSTLDEFEHGMRSIVRATPNAGIRLQSLPEHVRETALRVLTEQTHLHSLDLGLRGMPGLARNALAAMKTMLPRNPDLQHVGLNLSGCGLTNDHLGAIANSTEMKSLTSLRIGNNYAIDARGVAALANSANMAALDSLDLRGNLLVGNQGVVALANSQHLRLKSLELAFCSITHTGVAALANSEAARSLTHLGLRSNRLGRLAVDALVNSDKLRSDIHLEFRNNRIRDEDASALLARFQHVRVSSASGGRR